MLKLNSLEYEKNNGYSWNIFHNIPLILEIACSLLDVFPCLELCEWIFRHVAKLSFPPNFLLFYEGQGNLKVQVSLDLEIFELQ